MRINVGVPEAHVSKSVLDAALESVTRLDEQLLKDGAVPIAEKGIKDGVIWRPEPLGDEHFDHAGVVMRRRWGDCDDLAPWHAASLRHTGEDPEAHAIVRRSGPHRWHAIVQRGDGSIDDPSRWAGMGQPHPTRAATLPLMHGPVSGVNGAYIVRPSIALRQLPESKLWQARTDLPWHWREDLQRRPRPTDYAMVSLHSDPVASTALVGALEGACKIGICGGIAHPEHIKRLCAIADACDGVSYDEVAAVYGEEHAEAARQAVGSFFGKVRNIAKKGLRVATAPTRLVTKAAAGVVKHVPGVGPIAAKTLNAANAALKGDPKALAQLAKDPALQKLVSFVPGVGPVASTAMQAASKVFAAAPAAAATVLPSMGISQATLSRFFSNPEAFPVVSDTSNVVIPERYR